MSAAPPNDPISQAKLWAPVLLAFLAATALTLAFHHPLPYFDSWDFVPVYDKALRGELTLPMLLSPHNGHWLVAPFSVMLIADRLTGMAPWAEPVAGLIVMLMGGLLMIPMLEQRAQAFGLSRFAPWLAGLAAVFWFSLDQAPNWLWGLQVCVLLNVAAAAGLAASLAGPRLGLPELLGAAVAAVIAIYSYAAGLALLPMGFVMIALHPSSRRRRAAAAIVWAALSAALVAHYLFAVLLGPQDYLVGKAAPELDLAAFLGLFAFALTFLGGAVGRFSDGVAAPAALIGLGGAAWALLVLRRADRDWAGLTAPLIGFIAFGVTCGFIAAWGRLGLGVNQALVSRYISFANLFWIGALGLVLLAALKSGRRGRRGGFALIGFMLLLKLGNTANILIDKDVAGDHAKLVAAAERIRQTYPDVSDADLALVSTPSQAVVRPALDILARGRLSIFRDAR